jgi:hypothetical protein
MFDLIKKIITDVRYVMDTSSKVKNIIGAYFLGVGNDTSDDTIHQ